MARDPSAATRRFAILAVALVLPLVLAAVALPRLLGYLKAARTAAQATTRAAAAPAEGGAPGGDGRPSSPAAPAGFRQPSEAEREASRDADARLADAQRAWQGTSTLAPSPGRRDASGETVRRFQGFGVEVESVPPGARVLVNGAEAGETPLVAAVACSPGAAVSIEVRKAGHETWQTVTRCRADALVELAATLKRR